MAFEVSGKIIKILPVESKSATFQTREFVIEIPDGNYTQFVKFQLTQDRCGLVDAFKEGDSVKVSFNLRGREWQGKYFTNLDAWRIDSESGGAASGPAPSKNDPFGDVVFPEASDEPQQSGKSDEDDDLPF
jgi:single-strand DNA-binding protein